MSTELFCADYSAIEARVLFWLADHTDGVAAYHANRLLYEEMASKIFKKPISEVTRLDRELGKRVLLGCGYNMGWEKFRETCQTFGDFKVDDTLAQTAVSAYRELHWPIPVLWKKTEQAAIGAVRNRGRAFLAGKCRWLTQGHFLYCELPSGRKLAYYGPEIRYRETPWGEKRATLYHWSVNPISRQWGCAGTYGGRLVENMTQAVARDLMAEAMLRIEDAGYEIVLSVHDELLAEREKGKGSLKEFETLMSTLPPWAETLPVKVAGWSGVRYHK